MYLTLNNNWDGHPTGKVLFESDADLARRMLDLGVARAATETEIEGIVKQKIDHDNKMASVSSNKSKTKATSGRTKRPRNKRKVS